MLSVKELKLFVQRLTQKEFRQQLGPFVLVQRPERPTGAPGDTDQFGLPPNAQATSMAKPEAMSTGALSLLFQFEDLVVATVPPMQGVDELGVGRSPDNDLVLEHASASKRHAMLRWDAANQRCTVQDLGSTNGTFLNASVRLRRETTLKNGDILSFGEVQYWFLLTDTLYVKLRGPDTNRSL
ncbi:MAG: FHA domain-containing protein [Myxococcaceae bacterium]|nr:FHA domain-containing protein [Myxococcaceae bacterium]